jgi:hypothetical protein
VTRRVFEKVAQIVAQPFFVKLLQNFYLGEKYPPRKNGSTSVIKKIPRENSPNLVTLLRTLLMQQNICNKTFAICEAFITLVPT